MIYINTVCEDFLSEIVVEQVLASFGDKYCIASRYITDGNIKMKNSLKGYNEASSYIPFCVVTDLDNIMCASTLIQEWTTNIKVNQNLIFRVAVREIESWLLADTVGFSKFSGVPARHIPRVSDQIQDPKGMLIHLIREHGRKKIKQDVLPRDAHTAIGPNYNLSLSLFANDLWNVGRAAKNSKSLQRMLARLDSF